MKFWFAILFALSVAAPLQSQALEAPRFKNASSVAADGQRSVGGAASQDSSGIDIRRFGIKCDGTDETAKWAAMFATPAPRGIYHVPANVYCVFSAITLPAYTTLEGANRNSSILATNSPNGKAIKLEMGARLSDVFVTASVPRKADALIATSENGTIVSNIVCAHYFLCYSDIGADSSHISVINTLRDVQAFNPVVGTGTAFAVFENFGNATVEAVTASGPATGQQPDSGIVFMNGDTAYVTDTNISHHGAALVVFPGSAENTYALHVANSLFDSAGMISGGSTASSCEISPAGSVQEMVAANLWCGLSKGDGLLINPMGSGTINGLHIINGQFDGNAGSGIHIAGSGLSNFSFIGGSSGGNGLAGFNAGAASDSGVVFGMMLSANARNNNGSYGIYISAGSNLSFVGNQLSGARGQAYVSPKLKNIEILSAASISSVLLPTDPRFGAKCDGVTDDATAINAALAAAGARGNGRVQIPAGPGCAIGSTISVPAHVTLMGTGGAYPTSRSDGGLLAKRKNLDMISLTGDASTVRDLLVNAGAAGTNTSGTAIKMTVSNGERVIDSAILKPFIGIDINGNSPIVDRVTINDVAAGGVGWSVGRLTKQANTIDARIINSTVGGASVGAAYDQIIYDAGGLFEQNDDLLFANIGTQIKPGPNQQIIWPFFANTVLGDTNGTVAFAINTSASSAIVKGLNCSACWAASAQSAARGTNLLIANDGGGTIDGLHFSGSRIYNSAKVLALIQAGANISFDATQFCGAARGQANIQVAVDVSGIAFRGGHIGGACDGQGTAGEVGISFAGDNSNVTVQGVNFAGIGTPTTGGPTGDSFADNNSGLGAAPSISSAATISLPGIWHNYKITGATAISTIKGGWANRQALFITPSSLAFTTGGNICNALTSSANVPVLATYLESCWYLK